MKGRKAAGIDEIPMEAWRYEGKWVKQGLTDLVKQIWNKGGILKDRLEVIVPRYTKIVPIYAKKRTGIRQKITEVHIIVMHSLQTLCRNNKRKSGARRKRNCYRKVKWDLEKVGSY